MTEGFLFSKNSPTMMNEPPTIDTFLTPENVVKMAEAMNNDTAFKILCDLYVDTSKPADFFVREYGGKALEATSRLYDCGLMEFQFRNDVLNLTEAGYGMARRIESRTGKKIKRD